MKSNEVKLSNSLSCAVEALQEVERSCTIAGLSREQTHLMRLLTEEMIAMTTDILRSCKGSMWMEWSGRDCELHLTAVAPIEEEAKRAFIEASRAKANAPVRGLRSRIGALVAGLLSRGDYSELYQAMSAGFISGYPGGGMAQMPVWSLSVYTRAVPPAEERESDGLEKTILTGMADDVVVSVKSHWVELVVKKRFAEAKTEAMPQFAGLSHICIFVDDLMEGVSYYQKLLGAEPDHYLSH